MSSRNRESLHDHSYVNLFVEHSVLGIDTDKVLYVKEQQVEALGKVNSMVETPFNKMNIEDWLRVIEEIKQDPSNNNSISLKSLLFEPNRLGHFCKSILADQKIRVSKLVQLVKSRVDSGHDDPIKIILLDGHGRIVIQLALELRKLDLLKSVKLVVVDRDRHAQAWHQGFFPMDVESIQSDIYEYAKSQWKDAPIVYMNFCSIGGEKGHKLFAEYVNNWHKDGSRGDLLVSFSIMYQTRNKLPIAPWINMISNVVVAKRNPFVTLQINSKVETVIKVKKSTVCVKCQSSTTRYGNQYGSGIKCTNKDCGYKQFHRNC